MILYRLTLILDYQTLNLSLKQVKLSNFGNRLRKEMETLRKSEKGKRHFGLNLNDKS